MGSLSLGAGIPTWNGLPMVSGLPPIRGQYYHVYPYVGNNGNSGKSNTKPLDDFGFAVSNRITTNKGDGIILWSNQTATTADTTSYLSSSLTFSQSDVTVFGVNSGTRMYQRSRIANTTTVQTLTPLITVSGNNNAFYNISVFNSGTSATTCGGINVTGNRNLFVNCHIVGAGSTAAGAVAGAYSLAITGGQENTFINCTFGTDTVYPVIGANIRGVLTLASGGMRNTFEGCRFILSSSTTGHSSGCVLFSGAGDAIDRNVVFKDCIFEAYTDGGTTGVAGNCFVGTPPNNGNAILHNCSNIGFSAWGAASSRLLVTMPTSTASAGGGIATKL